MTILMEHMHGEFIRILSLTYMLDEQGRNMKKQEEIDFRGLAAYLGGKTGVVGLDQIRNMVLCNTNDHWK